jgi:hypothetical protein
MKSKSMIKMKITTRKDAATFRLGLLGPARRLQPQPRPEAGLEGGCVGRRKNAHGLENQALLDRGDLRLDTARHVQARHPPISESQIHIPKLRRNRNHEEIPRVTAVTDDDSRTNLAAAQVGERDRQEDNLISREAH